MAPSRRKSKASSAAAAAAARRQWKVGDLVLAKVKGFPAWPAAVSEPEKWGYSADWKKVLVYFFGTKQIAFCNPADVEAFTEEKKESLLVKRHGKGSDFVRAVQEIIESYEKSRKHDGVDDFNSVNEAIVTNASNSVDSLASSRLKDQTEASAGTFISQLNGSNSTKDVAELSPPAEDAVTNASHDRDTLSEEPTDDVVIAETPLATIFSKKRSVGKQLQSQVTRRRALRSRSSSRAHNLMVPSNECSKSGRDITSNVIWDGSLRRNKRIRRSPDASEHQDAASPAFVSNGSIEDNGSEIVTVDSDTLSFNEGSTLESHSNLEHTEAVECLERGVELSARLDLQIKAVVIKKKRKPNRKRVTTDAHELTAVLDKAVGGEVEVHKSRQNLENACEKSDGRFSKEDGDEHLPLVKRARVRMGKQSAVEENLNSSIKMEENLNRSIKMNENSSKEVPIIGQVYTSLKCDDDDSPADRDSFEVKEDVGNSSPLSTCFQFPDNRPQLLEGKKHQAFGSLDGEAALPPSKRLHRALEAMSANVAEDSLACAEAPETNGCCVSSIGKFNHMSKESKAEDGLGVQSIDSIGGNASEDHISRFSASVNSLGIEETKRSSVDADEEPVRSSKSTKDEVETAEGVVQSLNTDSLSLDLDGKHANPRSNQDSLDQLSSKVEEKCEYLGSTHDRAENPDKEVETSEPTGISTDSFSEAKKITKVSPQTPTTVHLYSEEASCCENAKSLKLPLDDNSRVDGVCESMREVNLKASQNAELFLTDADQGTKHLTHSASISDDSLGEKVVSGSQSRPSSAYGVLFPTLASPSNTSFNPMIRTNSNNLLQNNGSCSPEVQLPEKKAVCTLVVEEGKFDSTVTSVGKNNHAEASATLSSFETVLGVLTRTKESIGRATRIAIDSAKLGVASKVVEILARNLENESSLRKRVDLFFLVDSITQCSRGLKGDVGGKYLSAIQAALPRLLSAAAPPGSTAQENRRQCLKVLRLWLERRILPESVIRHHMRHLESLGGSSSTGAFCRRPLRNERAFDDPLREMEGMLVDEYGSNSSFQLQGFRMPRMLKVENEGSDSDGGSFEAVTPEHNSETPGEQVPTPTVMKHNHILEDVDGELEMEDVAPSCEVVMSSTSNANEGNTADTHHEQHFPPAFTPPLPNDVPPSSPPLPTSPPPLPPPPPLLPLSAVPGPYTNNDDSKLYVGTNNVQDNLQQSITQQVVEPRTEPVILDGLHYHAPERQEYPVETRFPDSTATCSFGNFPVSHPLRPMNNVPQTDGGALHNNAYHLQPPPPAPTSSNQFSYAQADQRRQSWRDAPFPHYSNRHHYPPNMDGGNYYTDHDRRNSIPHEFNESWRFSGPSFSGPVHPHDRARVPSAPVPYIHGESRIRNQGWGYPSQEMNHRNSMPIRPSCEGPRFWQPR